MTRKKEFYTAIDQIADKETFLESVQEGFFDIEDPRDNDNLAYPLVHLLVPTFPRSVIKN